MYRQSEKNCYAAIPPPHVLVKWWTSTRNGWDRFGSLGHPGKLQRVSRLCSVTAAMSLVGDQLRTSFEPARVMEFGFNSFDMTHFTSLSPLQPVYTPVVFLYEYVDEKSIQWLDFGQKFCSNSWLHRQTYIFHLWLVNPRIHEVFSSWYWLYKNRVIVNFVTFLRIKHNESA